MKPPVPTPVAKGTLATTPLGHVLLSIQKKGLSGTLVIWPNDTQSAQDRLLFRTGTPAAGRFIFPAADLERGILQMLSRPMNSQPDGTSSVYAFYEANLVGNKENAPRIAVNIFSVVAKALRTVAPDDAIERVIRKLGDQPQRLRQGAPLATLELQSNEMAFVDLLRAEPAPASTLIEQFGDPKVARRMVYLLALTGCLEPYRLKRTHTPKHEAAERVGGEGSTAEREHHTADLQQHPPTQRPPSTHHHDENHAATSNNTGHPIDPVAASASDVVAPRTLPPRPPPNLQRKLTERWNDISNAVAAIDRQNYFEILGVTESANTAEIQAQYLKSAKKWHPDQLPPELATLRPWTEEVFHTLTVAYDTLSNPTSRATYEKNLEHGVGTPEAERKVSAMVQTAINFQKVDVLVKRRRYDEALEICEQAINVVPNEADYPAMKAWILFLRNGLSAYNSSAEIRTLLRKTFSINPDHTHGHFVRAHVLKRQGDYDTALKHFKKVVKADPKNLDAVREVRIGTSRLARGTSSAPPASITGRRQRLFGKLFKK